MSARSFASILYANYDYISRITDRVGEADALMVTTQAHDVASVDAGSRALEDKFRAAWACAWTWSAPC